MTTKLEPQQIVEIAREQLLCHEMLWRDSIRTDESNAEIAYNEGAKDALEYFLKTIRAKS